MFKTINLAKVATGVVGAMVFSTLCVAGALTAAQPLQITAHVLA
jgi:hypothetical protein